jgi:hypothetical protein
VTSEGDTLTLAERLAHHYTTGLSTVEAAAEHHERLVEEFAAYYESAQQDPPGEYETYVVRREGQGERVAALAAHLDRQRIRYGYATETTTAEGYAYRSGETTSVQIREGDLVVDAAQPKARLVKVLFEPRTTVPDSLTYDITAWGLPYAYAVEAYALPERTVPDTSSTPPPAPGLTGTTDAPYAYATPWRSRADARFVGALLRAGVRVRVASEGFTVGGRRFGRGTLLVTRAGNTDRLERFDERVRRLARAHDQSLHGLSTGFTEQGPDLGSGTVNVLEAPTVAVLSGPPLSPSGVGEVWHFFDHRLAYPATLLPADDFAAGMLEDVDVLVLPDGDYDAWLTDDRARAVTRWTRTGGRLLALGDANGALAARPEYRLTEKDAERAPDTSEVGAQGYGSQSQASLPTSTPGSIHRAQVDPTHPLAYGLTSPYFTLKRNDDAYVLPEEGWAVGTLAGGAPVSGFMGGEAQQTIEDTLLFGTQRLGEGRVVYFVDNPLFRGFWYGGHLLFSNAVFMVGPR